MLPAKNRLKLPTKWNRNYPDFQFKNPHYKILGKKITSSAEARLGFIISGKVGTATVRNRIRRILEVDFKDFLEKASGLEIVLIVYPSAKGLSNEELHTISYQTISKIPLR